MSHESKLAAQRRYRNSPKGRARAWAGKLRRYGLTPDDFNLLLTLGGGACWLCGQEFTSADVPCVDHDHSCCPAPAASCGNCVRGLLHQRCNLLLGLANDDIERLIDALKYLSRPLPDGPWRDADGVAA